MLYPRGSRFRKKPLTGRPAARKMGMRLAIARCSLAVLMAAVPFMAQTAKQDMKNAGSDVKDAGKDVGHATKRTAIKAKHKTKHAVHRSAATVEQKTSK
jgi:hypothetical protein